MVVLVLTHGKKLAGFKNPIARELVLSLGKSAIGHPGMDGTVAVQ